MMYLKTFSFMSLAALAVVALPSTWSIDGESGTENHIHFVRPRQVEEDSTVPEPDTSLPWGIGDKLHDESSENDDNLSAANPRYKQLSVQFPGGTKPGLPHWSTDPSVGGAIPLSDQSIGSIKVASRHPHPVVMYAGKRAMKVSFARGSYGLDSSAPGGMSLYALGPSGQRMNNAKVVTLSYSVNFSPGFKFNIGGKLPGLYGGTSDEAASSCSGGRNSDTCWTARFMWRANGKGELYAYLPPSAKNTNKRAVCSPQNKSCDSTYGWSLGRGKWTWAPGRWQRIAQKVTLNDIGKANGSIVTYVNGSPVYSAKNIVIRTQREARPRGIMLQSFFGGHTAEWAAPQDESLYLADFSVAVLKAD